jgi:hypothetical protein
MPAAPSGGFAFPYPANPSGGVPWRQPLNQGASSWAGQTPPPGPGYPPPGGGAWPPYDPEYGRAAAHAAASNLSVIPGYGAAEAHAAASNLSVIPGYGAAAAHATAAGLSSIPGYGMPEGASAYQGNPGGQAGTSGPASSGPYHGLYGSARVTSTSPDKPAPTEDTNRVLRLLKYATPAGGLEWPLALRVLPPGPEATQAREQIDQLLAEARRESASGQVKPALVEDLRRAVKELRRLWADRGENLPLSAEAINAGRDFLRRLDRALE